VGSYTSFSVDGYQLLSSKSYVGAVVMTVFTEAEKYVREVLQADSDSKDEHSLTEVGYAASGEIIRDRLEVMGFTLPATRAVFEAGIHQQVQDTEEFSASCANKSEGETTSNEIGEVYERVAEGYAEEIRMLQLLSFDVWIESFRSLKGKDLNSWHLTLKEGDASVRDLPSLERFMLSGDEFPFRFPPCDVRFLIRAVIEACGVNSVFQLDLTDVTSSGYYEIADPVAENARAELTSDYPLNTKVVVLTEGITDRRVLEASLRILYPHLDEYYSFMDFDSANAPGGAGQLVNTVKAFAGAGIANRVVALFDNDTAACAALRGLNGVALPRSMRVRQFPVIAIASNYPTIGPSGLVNMNVNGLAGSLEMYFGEDILRRADGTLAPVHWRGFDSAIRAYQGELESKRDLQAKFDQKVAVAATNPVTIRTQDWSGIRAILDMVRGAFENEGALTDR
jgi:hypothetical protein